MDYLVDRTSYRRQDRFEEKEKDNQIVYLIIKKLLIQSIAGIIILTIIFTAKVMKMNRIMNWLHEEANKEVPISVAYNEIKNKINEAYNFVNALQKSNGENLNSVDLVENNSSDLILSIHTDEPNEIVFEEAVEGINQMSEDAKFIKNNYSLIYPIRGTVTSRFGVRTSENPIVTPYHSGIDIAANTGTKILASLSGEVITSTTGESYGKYIMIQTDDIITVYAHCSKLLVKKGQKVKQGETIGEVGSTGWATGPHLHFEIRYLDRLVNPANVLDFGE